MITASLAAIFPSNECMKDQSLYTIEDMQTMVMPKYSAAPRDMYDIVGQAFWAMHWHWAYISHSTGKSLANYGGVGLTQHPIYKDLVNAIHAYDSIAFIVRGKRPPPKEITRGTDHFAYGHGHPNVQTKQQILARRHPGVHSKGGDAATWAAATDRAQADVLAVAQIEASSSAGDQQTSSAVQERQQPDVSKSYDSMHAPVHQTIMCNKRNITTTDAHTRSDECTNYTATRDTAPSPPVPLHTCGRV